MYEFSKGQAIALALLLGGALGWTAVSAETVAPINPYPRATISDEEVAAWEFDAGVSDWHAVHNVQLRGDAGKLHITATGADPYLHAPHVEVEGEAFVLKLRMRSQGRGDGEIFWRTQENPSWSAERSARFRMHHDGDWHQYTIFLPVGGTLRQWRLDPGTGAGTAAIDRALLRKRRLHPIEIQHVQIRGSEGVASIKNHADHPIGIALASKSRMISGNATKKVTTHVEAQAPFETLPLQVKAEGYPTILRKYYLHWPDNDAERWIRLSEGSLELKVAPDGSGARIIRAGRLVAVLSPLLQASPLKRGVEAIPLDGRRQADHVRLSGPRGESLRLWLEGETVRYDVRAQEELGGPVVRAIGDLEQGLFAGVEYLGQGERSSSRLDIHTPEHVRFAPEPNDLTMPLMGFVTDRASVAMMWEKMPIQPVYATPNFFDGTGDHRMSLKGKEFRGQIRVSEGWQDGGRLADTISWAVKERGLPEPPARPRVLQEQRELCLAAYAGPLRTDQGWGHCAEERWPRNFFADHASAIWRLSGEMPEVPRLVPGGAHISNPASFLVTDRAEIWLEHLQTEAKQARASQQSDGGFRYDGKYRQGHFEDTASGYCARRAWRLLRHAWYTGNRASLQAGTSALEYMKRFRTPRGAQTWEVPLHTPDILASAYLVKAYVLGHQLTGRADFLRLARRWALSGLPFVYQWSDKPIMLYATIAVYGATNWEAPNWIGRPVQWCGTVYADALLKLGPLDDTLDWQQIAEGITRSGEHMQYPSGDPFVGCLPDSIMLASQERKPWNINPGPLVSLRLQLDGRLDDLDVGQLGEYRLVAPFPIQIRDDHAIIKGSDVERYQVIVDGEPRLTVNRAGKYTIDLKDLRR